MTHRHFIPPIVYITIAFIMGIILASMDFGVYLPLLMIISILVSLTSWRSYAVPIEKRFLLILLLSCVTGSLSLYRQQCYFTHYMQILPKKACSIRAIITDVLYTPEKKFPYRYTLKITHIKDHTDEWRTYTCHIHLFIRTSTPTLHPGVTFETKPIKINPISKEELHNYAMKLGITGTLFCSAFNYTIIQDNSHTWWYAKYRLIEYFRQHLSSNCFSMVSAIFLGNKSYNNKDQRTLFAQWGIAHHLARSGLHLMIIILLWSTCTALLPIKFYIKQGILCAFTLLYFHMSWASIPFYRALWIFILHRICLLLRIQCHMLHSLAFVCLACLIYNPIHLFFLDFQLSFALTFALILINHLETMRATKPHEILAQ